MLLITSFHILDSSNPNLHNHLKSRAVFLSLKEPIPRPPRMFWKSNSGPADIAYFVPFLISRPEEGSEFLINFGGYRNRHGEHRYVVDGEITEHRFNQAQTTPNI
jgi:hypothetical protein